MASRLTSCCVAFSTRLASVRLPSSGVTSLRTRSYSVWGRFAAPVKVKSTTSKGPAFVRMLAALGVVCWTTTIWPAVPMIVELTSTRRSARPLGGGAYGSTYDPSSAVVTGFPALTSPAGPCWNAETVRPFTGLPSAFSTLPRTMRPAVAIWLSFELITARVDASTAPVAGRPNSCCSALTTALVPAPSTRRETSSAGRLLPSLASASWRRATSSPCVPSESWGGNCASTAALMAFAVTASTMPVVGSVCPF